MTPGTRFGRYAILEMIGSGGMGAVYRARDTVLGRVVALKVLHADTEEPSRRMARVLREGRAAASIDHPNAVAIFDVDEAEGVPFLAMELVTGKSLRRLVTEGEASREERVRWLVDVAAALAAAHRRGVIHRDVKPENVIVREDGTVKVVDFGIARPLPSIDREAVTRSMQIARDEAAARPDIATWGIRGTPAYMAPEQLRGEPLDARADQFAWGILAFEVLTGEHPWPARDLVELVRSIALVPAPAFDAGGIEWVIARALAKGRQDRFGSMEEVIAALHAARASGRKRGITVGRAAFAGALMCMVGAASTPEPAAKARAPVPKVELAAKPEALAQYREGLQLLRDGSREAAVEAFDRAAAADPGFAAAHLRAAMFSDAPDVAMRTHLQRAWQLRAGLTERERAFLHAYEPWTFAPADWNESVRRLERIVEKGPTDAEAWLALGLGRTHAADYRGELEAFDQASALDPGSAAGWEGKAIAQLFHDDESGALQSYERCLDVSPASQACLQGRIQFLQMGGQCEEAVSTAHRLIALSPNAAENYLHLANALYGEGAGLGAVRAAVERATSLEPASKRLSASLGRAAHLAVLGGDFEAASRYANAWQRSVEGISQERSHLSPSWYRMAVALETKRSLEAASLAHDYLRRRAGWTPEDYDRNPTIFVIDILNRTGTIDAAGIARMREDWLIAERQRQKQTGDTRPIFAWILGYALLALSKDDALEALAALPSFGQLPSSVNVGLDFEIIIGNVYRLAGDLSEAAKHLRIANAACDALSYPFQHVWSLLRLGEVFDLAGDREAACAQYEKVVAAWGAAPMSVTVDAAKAGLTRLGCH